MFIFFYIHNLQIACKVDNRNPFKIKLIADLYNDNHLCNSVRSSDAYVRQ